MGPEASQGIPLTLEEFCDLRDEREGVWEYWGGYGVGKSPALQPDAVNAIHRAIYRTLPDHLFTRTLSHVKTMGGTLRCPELIVAHQKSRSFRVAHDLPYLPDPLLVLDGQRDEETWETTLGRVTEYRVVGVPEVWLLNPDLTITTWTLEDEQYCEETRGPDETLTIKCCPKLTFRPAASKLWNLPDPEPQQH